MMIIPIFHTRERAPDPKCPHCRETLEGYSEPGNMTLGEFLIVLFVMLFVLGQVFSMVFGFMDGVIFDREPCPRAFSKRYHYAIPLQAPMCHFGKWMTNQDKPVETYSKDDSKSIDYSKREVEYE